MTTIAMGAGMLPIALGLSGDPSFRAPMGVAVIGGLLASTALSLFVVPVVYTLMDDMLLWLKRLFSFNRSPAAPAAAAGPVCPRVIDTFHATPLITSGRGARIQVERAKNAS